MVGSDYGHSRKINPVFHGKRRVSNGTTNGKPRKYFEQSVSFDTTQVVYVTSCGKFLFAHVAINVLHVHGWMTNFFIEDWRQFAQF